jgi:hypothetical protein
MVRPLKTDHQRMCFKRPMTAKERKHKYMLKFPTKEMKRALWRKWKMAALLNKISRLLKAGKPFVHRRRGAQPGNWNSLKHGRYSRRLR